MAPRRRRDLAVLVCNGVMTLSAAFTPLLAWAILSTDWHFNIGFLTMRPWRVLTITYALPLVLTSIWMTQAKESPKFLMSKGRKQEALEVLRHVYMKNTGLPKEKYDVQSLKKSTEELMDADSSDCSDEEIIEKSREGSAWALLRPPHLKWFLLTSFLMFGLFSALNGLFLFATDTINKVLSEPDQTGTLCTIMNRPDNETSTQKCVDTISQDTFIIMVTTTTVYGVIVLIASVIPLSKKTLLVAMYLISAAAAFLAVLITNMVVAGVAFSALQMAALGIGPLTAYAVQLFPTNLRGCAVGGVLMWGRVGSVAGANLAGYLLVIACTPTFYVFGTLLVGVLMWGRVGSVAGANLAGYLLVIACTPTFYVFGTLLVVCAALSFLLPKAPPRHDPERINNNNNR
ncbi:organic cation/carnitine transporter 7-like isoform X1 [Phthorimaea operculella]|nr:organic cation/carnitine transporter 7-like isoform X1 [Phthorimaea operculella]